jgi:PKD repeat protein
VTGNVIESFGFFGIHCSNYSSPRISGNTISCTGGEAGIYCHGSPASISENTITVSGMDDTGIQCSESAVSISGNTIINTGSWGFGIDSHSSSPIISNNTIVTTGSSSYGIYLGGSPGSAVVRHNIVVASERGIAGDSNCVTPEIVYNDVVGSPPFDGDCLPASIGVLITENANGDSCDTYFNIMLDPQFVDEGAGNYNLLATSPCIDAGDPNPVYFDLDGTIADLGAFPYLQSSPNAPIISFAGTPTSGTSPLGVAFAHTNSGGPVVSWLWDFGDGATSILPNPVHNYVTDVLSSYTVSLAVMGPDSSDVLILSDYITVAPDTTPPLADFTADPLVGYGDVQFTDLSSGAPTSWEWALGDGQSSFDQHPLHTYDPGTYTVRLIATNSAGADTVTKVDYILVVPTETVIAGFTASPTIGAVPLDVSFTNTSQGTITSYLWDFGDSTTSTLADPTHQYTEAGQYDVRLIATGPANSDTAQATIEAVLPGPQIVSITDVDGDQGRHVRLVWERAYFDAPGTGPDINGYGIYRRQDFVPGPLAGGIARESGWDSMGWIDAHGDSVYQYVASTLCDSTGAAGICWSVFFVRATTADPFTYFDSPPDSGYSVDNLAPAAPTGLVIAAATLTWDECPDADFAYFTVYGSDTGTIEDAVLLGHTVETRRDVRAEPYAWYLVAATDFAGNQGDAAVILNTETGVLASGIRPDTFDLRGPQPNPFSESTTIAFDIPIPCHATLRVFDVGGRLVRTLASGETRPGRFRPRWDGRDDSGRLTSPGVYFVRLDSGDFSATKKMVRTR